jgi:hypothetical protein
MKHYVFCIIALCCLSLNAARADENWVKFPISYESIWNDAQDPKGTDVARAIELLKDYIDPQVTSMFPEFFSRLFTIHANRRYINDAEFRAAVFERNFENINDLSLYMKNHVFSKSSDEGQMGIEEKKTSDTPLVVGSLFQRMRFIVIKEHEATLKREALKAIEREKKHQKVVTRFDDIIQSDEDLKEKVEKIRENVAISFYFNPILPHFPPHHAKLQKNGNEINSVDYEYLVPNDNMY